MAEMVGMADRQNGQMVGMVKWQDGWNGRMAVMVGMADGRNGQMVGMVEWQKWLHTYYLRYTPMIPIAEWRNGTRMVGMVGIVGMVEMVRMAGMVDGMVNRIVK